MSTNLIIADRNSRPALSLQQLKREAPAIFAEHQFVNTGSNYVFISTQELIEALMDSGFHPTFVCQRRSRGERLGYARHMLRFRHRDAVQVVDCMPEVMLINSHDGTGAYQMRGGLYRFVCSNGLVISLTEFGLIRVPHRGNVIASVVEAAQQLSHQFQGIGEVIERMAQTHLDPRIQAAFARKALEMRYRHQDHFPFDAERLLTVNREADAGDDLWRVYNRVQENVINGGIDGRTAHGRRTTTRAIRAIDENVRLNLAMWQEAMRLIRA